MLTCCSDLKNPTGTSKTTNISKIRIETLVTPSRTGAHQKRL
tara:strand:- start:8268 stop:8393 length:126 start_codon:yes stop_codon:yes gene_type:complete